MNDEDLAELYEETKKFHISLVKELKELNCNKTALAVEKLEELLSYFKENKHGISNINSKEEDWVKFDYVENKINSMIEELKGAKDE